MNKNHLVDLKMFIELWQEEIEPKDVLTVKEMNVMMNDFNEFDRFTHFYDSLKGESVVFLKRDVYIRSETVLETAKQFLDKVGRGYLMNDKSKRNVKEYSMNDNIKRDILEMVERWENKLRNRSLIQVFRMNEMINEFRKFGNFEFDYVVAKYSVIYLNRDVFVEDRTNTDVARKFLKELKRTDNYSLTKVEGNKDSTDIIKRVDKINSQIEDLEKTKDIDLILGRSRQTNKIKLSVLY